jgi:succinate dehydrogenase/fumarate reductase flavoprotein subunit
MLSELEAYQETIERLMDAFDCPNPAALVEHIQAVMEQRVATEREACAKIADAGNNSVLRRISDDAALMSTVIAKHIRARGQAD